MGYTHYFSTLEKELSASKFLQFTSGVRKIFKAAKAQGYKLQYSYNDTSAPFAREDEVYCNGVGDDRHEDLVILRRCTDYCKTSRKPYDAVVCAILIAFKVTFKSQVFIRTDGNEDDWMDGAELYTSATGTRPPIAITEMNGFGTLTYVPFK